MILNRSIKIILFVSAVALPLQAQVEADPRMGQPSIGQTGKLFTLQYYPQNQEFSVSMAGTEIATIDPLRYKVFGHVMPRGGKKQAVEIVREKNFYKIMNAPNTSAPVIIRIEDQKTKKAETFQVELKPKN